MDQRVCHRSFLNVLDFFNFDIIVPGARATSHTAFFWIDCKLPGLACQPELLFMHKVFMPFHIYGYKFFGYKRNNIHQHPPATTFFRPSIPRTSSSYLRLAVAFTLLWSWILFSAIAQNKRIRDSLLGILLNFLIYSDWFWFYFWCF